MVQRNPEFDPYHKWLGIPRSKRRPNFYVLLGISPKEKDADVIRAASEQRRQFVSGQLGLGHDDVVNSMLLELQEAELTLTNSVMRQDYDRRLKISSKRKQSGLARSGVESSDSVYEGERGAVGEDSGVLPTFAGIVAILVVGFGAMALFSFQLPWSTPVESVKSRAAEAPAPKEADALAGPPAVVEPKLAPPELVAVLIEGVDEAADHPWVSPDGLTLYFRNGGLTRVAHRADASQPFILGRELFRGLDPTFSADGLEAFFLLPRNRGGLATASRARVQDDFSEPKPVPGLGDEHGFIAAPCLSADGLTLYFDLVGDGSTQITLPTLNSNIRDLVMSYSTRSSRDASWSEPRPIPLERQWPRSRFPYVSADGHYFCCTLLGVRKQDRSNILLCYREQLDQPFREVGLVEPEGIVVRGGFPRYIPATNELFIVGRSESTGRNELMVLRNFVPNQ